MKLLIITCSLFTLAYAQYDWCPPFFAFFDNDTAPIVSRKMPDRIVSISIKNKTIASLLQVSIGESADIFQVAPLNPAFENYLDDFGISKLESDPEDPSDGINVVFEGDPSTAESCYITLMIKDSNNQPPVFSKPGPLEFTIPKTYDPLIALNWDLNNALQVTDKDYSIENADISIESVNGLVRGTVKIRNLDETPPNVFLYDIQVFVEGSINNTGEIIDTLIASDGVNSDQLDVVVNVYDPSFNAPVFLETKYHHSFETMPEVGQVITLIKAEDLDNPSNGVIQYEISPSEDFLQIDKGTGELKIISSVVQYAGQAKDLTILATKISEDKQISTEVKLSLQFPALKFMNGSYTRKLEELPKKDQTLLKVKLSEDVGIQPNIKFRKETSYPEFISVNEADGTVYFNSDLTNSTDLGEYKENGVIIFNVIAESELDRDKSAAITAIMATFPLEQEQQPESTTVTSPTTQPPCECEEETSTNSPSFPPCESTTPPQSKSTTTTAKGEEFTEDCPKTALLSALAAISFVCVVSIIGAGYLFWKLRKATSVPFSVTKDLTSENIKLGKVSKVIH